MKPRTPSRYRRASLLDIINLPVAAPACMIDQLYDTLLLHTLGFCALNELLLHCLHVSKHWNAILRDPKICRSVWKYHREEIHTFTRYLDLVRFDSTYKKNNRWRLQHTASLEMDCHIEGATEDDTARLVNERDRLFRTFTQWTHVHLYNAGSVRLQSLLQLPHLQVLELYGVKQWVGGDDGSDALDSICSSLHSIAYQALPNEGASAPLPLLLLRSCPSLTELQFFHEVNEEFAGALNRLPQLTHLGWQLCMDGFNEEAHSESFASLQRIVSVPTLLRFTILFEIHTQMLTPRIHSELRSCLAPCASRLTTLDLDLCMNGVVNFADDLPFQNLLHAIASCQVLEHLELARSDLYSSNHPQFRTKGLKILAHLGRTLKTFTMESVDLSLNAYKRLPQLFPLLTHISLMLPQNTAISTYLHGLASYRSVQRCCIKIESIRNDLRFSAQQFVNAGRHLLPTPHHRLLLPYHKYNEKWGWLPPDEPARPAFIPDTVNLEHRDCCRARFCAGNGGCIWMVKNS